MASAGQLVQDVIAARAPPPRAGLALRRLARLISTVLKRTSERGAVVG